MEKTKYALRTGDVVLSTKGSIGIVYRSLENSTEGVIKWVRNQGGHIINKYRTLGMVNNDLTFKYDNDNRIIKVWRPFVYREVGDIYLTMVHTNLIYEENIKEVTMDEVEAKFGCKVKIKNND